VLLVAQFLHNLAAVQVHVELQGFASPSVSRAQIIMMNGIQDHEGRG
jgi:hypothetical protein